VVDELIRDETGALLCPGTVEHWHANAQRNVDVSASRHRTLPTPKQSGGVFFAGRNSNHLSGE
jgi:hypothetical protein